MWEDKAVPERNLHTDVKGQRHVCARVHVSPPSELTLWVFPLWWTGLPLYWGFHHLRRQRCLHMQSAKHSEGPNHPIPQNPPTTCRHGCIIHQNESGWVTRGPLPDDKARPGSGAVGPGWLCFTCSEPTWLPFSEWKSWILFSFFSASIPAWLQTSRPLQPCLLENHNLYHLSENHL